MTDDQELTPSQAAKLDKLKLEWDAAKNKRDQDCEAAWQLPIGDDPDVRRKAYDAAKAEWETTKAELLEREAAIRAG